MARKPASESGDKAPRKPRKVKTEGEGASTEGAIVRISAKALNELIAEANMCMQRSSEFGGQLGQSIKTATQTKGLDPVAFRFILRLRRMGERDPAKLASVLYNFDDYRGKSKLDKLKAQDLFRDFEPAADTGASDNGDGDDGRPSESSNVTHFDRPAA